MRMKLFTKKRTRGLYGLLVQGLVMPRTDSFVQSPVKGGLLLHRQMYRATNYEKISFCKRKESRKDPFGNGGRLVKKECIDCSNV